MGRHGVSDAERARPQRFTVDVEIEANLARAGKSDRIEDTVDYRLVHAIAKEVVEGESAHLIEALAEQIAKRTLEVPSIRAVSVRVAKRPPRLRPLEAAAVRIRRSRR
jgi:dihydroneopterin aldolase